MQLEIAIYECGVCASLTCYPEGSVAVAAPGRGTTTCSNRCLHFWRNGITWQDLLSRRCQFCDGAIPAEVGSIKARYCSARCQKANARQKRNATARKRYKRSAYRGQKVEGRELRRCETCGELTGGRPRFCSEKCSHQYGAIPTNCEVCAAVFLPLRANRPQRTCSRSCSAVLKYRERIAATPSAPKRASRCKQCRAKDRQGLSDYCSQECKDCRKRQDRLDREYQAPGLSVSQRYALLQEWKKSRTCTYCDAPCETVDHIIPLVHGGTNHEGNLTPACRRCNSTKGSKLLAEWRYGAPHIRERLTKAA